MYIYEKRALKRCQHVIMRDLNPNETFLIQLVNGGVIDSTQRQHICEEETQHDKLALLLDIMSNQEDGTCLRLISVLKTDYPWISIHLQREFLKEKTLFNKEFNEELSDVVNNQINPMVLGPNAETCRVPHSAKDSSVCVDTIADLLQKLKTTSYRPLNVDPLHICNMALCVILEEKIVKFKNHIDELQERVTRLRMPSKNIRILQQEIRNEKEAAKQLDKKNKIKDSAIDHLKHQNALLKQQLEALQKSNNKVCSICNARCGHIHSLKTK